MSGHVFHPGHDELHGITVVIETRSGQTVVGRFHERTDGGVALHDVAVHQSGGSAEPVADWLARQRKFGIGVTHRHFAVQSDEVVELRRFVD